MNTFEFQPFQAHFLFDYIRMVGYSLIILTDLRNIVNRKFSTILFVGDILMSFALLIASLNIITTGFDQTIIADKVLTPAVVIWAGIHFYEFVNQSSNK